LGQSPGEDQCDAPGGFAANEFLMEHDGKEDPDGDVENDVDHRPESGLEQDRPEKRLPKNGGVLGEADQSPIANVVEVRVREGEDDVEEEGEENDREDDEQCRGEKEGVKKARPHISTVRGFLGRDEGEAELRGPPRINQSLHRLHAPALPRVAPRAQENRQLLLSLRLARQPLRQGDARPDLRREQLR